LKTSTTSKIRFGRITHLTSWNQIKRNSYRTINQKQLASFSSKSESVTMKEESDQLFDSNSSIITMEGESLVIIDKFNPDHKIYRWPDGTVMIQCAFGDVIRYGENDSIITLNVGGKEFKTLISTIATCEKLVHIVMKARGNNDMSHDEGKTVFIDRDPEVFAYLVTYLRNRVEGISIHSTAIQKLHKNMKYVKLPTETTKLRALYVEASYFKLKELELEICASTVVSSITSAITGGGSNPFDDASRFIKNARNFTVVGGSFLTTAHVSGVTPESWQAVLDIIPKISS